MGDYKTFYYAVLFGTELKHRKFHYFLFSAWGTKDDEDKARSKAYEEAEAIVAALAKEDGLPYKLLMLDDINNRQYTVLKEYFTHYVDRTLHRYDNSPQEEEPEDEA